MISQGQRRKRSEEEKGHHHRDSNPNHDGWNLAVPNWSGGSNPNLNANSNSNSDPTPTSSGTEYVTRSSATTGSTNQAYYTWSRTDGGEASTAVEPSGVQGPTAVASGSTDRAPEYVAAPEQKGLGDKVMGAIAGTMAMMALLIIGLIAFLWLRKRRRQRQQQASQSQMQQIKTATQPYTPPRTRTSAIYPQYAAPPNHSPPPTLAPPPPVILGPIVPGSNGAYYTGIDTSDVVSVHDRSGLGNPFADGDSLNDEPPPPYRPRSFGLMSRNSSLRAPPVATTSQTHLIGENHQPNRSPFEDPLDDDAISEISSPTLRGINDRMSVVSDLSYQEDPVVTRPAV